MGTVFEAIVQVLNEADQPLHYQDITERIFEKGLWETDNQTPWSTVNVTISLDLRDKGNESKFVRVKRGIYALREKTYQTNSKVSEDISELVEESLSFGDAAELILEEQSTNTPVHYRQLMDLILERKLISTESKTPETSLYASVHQEIQRYEKLSETPRFFIQKGGNIGLSKWMPKGLEGDIYTRNTMMRDKLLSQLKKMEPEGFEQLINLLLVRMGFEEVETTDYRNDGGIDVRGTLVVGDVIRTKMAIQVKRYSSQNIQAPVVREVRGSLGTHEQGLIITTSDFSAGARAEAERNDAIPIGLMNGRQLVRLLVEHEVGIKRKPAEIFELSPIELDNGD